MSLPEPPKMNFQSSTINFHLSPTVFGSLPGQQFQQILPRYQSCYPDYLDIFKPLLKLAVATHGESWHYINCHTHCTSPSQ